MTKKKLKLSVYITENSEQVTFIITDNSRPSESLYRAIRGLYTMGHLILQVDAHWNWFNRKRITEEEKKEFEEKARKVIGNRRIQDVEWR